MKIKVKDLIYFQIIYNCFIKLFISDFHFPGILNYVTDFINILLFIVVILNIKSGIYKNMKIPPLKWAIMLLILNLISFVIDFSNPALFIWGFRNIYRFFVFFFSCIYVLNMDDVKKIFNLLYKIFLINIVICLFEYFVRGIKFDNLGGIFGNNVVGGNGPLNVLLVLIDIYVFVMYVKKEKSFLELILTLGISLIIASLAELKILYFEIIILVILMCTLIKRNIKMILIVGVISIVGVGALSIFNKLYPKKAGFLSLDFIEKYALTDTYGEGTGINRFSAISIINENFFRNNYKYKLIGMGLGNAEVSQFSGLTSKFYNLYGSSFKYNWFSHSFMYLESGYIGLAFYIIFFLNIMYDSFKLKNENKYVTISFLFTFFCLVFIVYNQCLRIETMAYTSFFVLAIPYIYLKSKYNKKNKEN